MKLSLLVLIQSFCFAAFYTAESVAIAFEMVGQMWITAARELAFPDPIDGQPLPEFIAGKVQLHLAPVRQAFRNIPPRNGINYRAIDANYKAFWRQMEAEFSRAGNIQDINIRLFAAQVNKEFLKSLRFEQ